MPALTIFANPRKHRKNPRPAKSVATLTNRVEEIRYRHKADGKWYKHKFEPGASVKLLEDGRALIERKDGKPVWMDDSPLDSGRDDVHFFINPTHGAKKAKSSRRRRRTTKARIPVKRHRPKKRSTDMARKRARKRVVRHRRRHVVARRHAVNPKRRRRRAVAVRRAAAPRRRRRHLANPARKRHARRYHRNPGGLGFKSILQDAKGGVGVVVGQQATRKLGALAKQYVPGMTTATGPMALIPTLLAAIGTSIAARKFARQWAPFIAAGAFSEVINGGLALTPASSFLSAYPRVVGVSAWPAVGAGGNAALPAGRTVVGVRAWPARSGSVREVG